MKRRIAFLLPLTLACQATRILDGVGAADPTASQGGEANNSPPDGSGANNNSSIGGDPLVGGDSDSAGAANSGAAASGGHEGGSVEEDCSANCNALPPLTCMQAQCNAITKQCEYVPTDGASCDDGEWCSAGGTCNAGICQDGAATPGCVHWQQVDVNAYHVCGTKVDGTLWCWGQADAGRLSVELAGAIQEIPLQVGSATNWAMGVPKANPVSYAITSTGELWSFGTSGWSNAELGLGPDTPITFVPPSPVASTKAWSKVVGGFTAACGLKVDGTVWCWGNPLWGSLGLPEETAWDAPHTPVAITGTWKDIASGSASSCGIKLDGTLWCWGLGDSGQLGVGDLAQLEYDESGPGTLAHSWSHRQVGSDPTWTQVSARNNSVCGLRADSSAWCWGNSYKGQAGQFDQNVLAPNYIGDNFTQLSAGGETSCGVKIDGTLWCWGDGGGLGTGWPSDDTDTPVLVTTETDWQSVSSSGANTCAIKNDGSLWCWGYCQSGQCGIAGASQTGLVVPTQVL
jgi:alpha-tubulin suppressor-like RCC1 family protein